MRKINPTSSADLGRQLPDSFSGKLSALAEMGIGVRRAPNWKEEEEEKKEEEEKLREASWWDYVEVPAKQLASGTAQIFTESAASVGTLTAWAKGQVGLSGDPEDNFLYRAGTEGTEMAEIDYLPNNFRGGGTGFFLSDAPKGVGSALGFVGTGGVYGAVGKGVGKLAAKQVAKNLAKPSNFRRAIKKQDEALKGNKIKQATGPSSMSQSWYKNEAKDIVGKRARKTRADAMERLPKLGQSTGQVAGVGTTGMAVSAMEGYRDAVSHLRAEAIRQGKDPDSIDYGVAYDAYFAAAPAGLLELLGVELPLLRAMRGASTVEDLAKHGGDNLVRKSFATKAAIALHKNLDNVTKGRFSAGLAAFSKRANGSKWVHNSKLVVGNMAQEGAQEAAQGAWLNYVAANIAGYDKNRDLFDGLVHQGGVGGVVGGVFGLVTVALRRRAANIDRLKNLEDRAAQLRERGAEEQADSVQAEADKLKAQIIADNVTEAAVDNQIAANDTTRVEIAETISAPAAGETLDFDGGAPAPETAATPAAESDVVPLEGAALDRSIDATSMASKISNETDEMTPAEKWDYLDNLEATVELNEAEQDVVNGRRAELQELIDKVAGTEASPAAETLGWNEARETLDVTASDETIAEAIELGVPASSVNPDKNVITENRVRAAIDKWPETKALDEQFTEETTETQSDEEIIKAVEGKGARLKVVKREKGKPLSDPKTKKIYQVVALDKDGNEVAKLSPPMTKKAAGAFMFRQVQPRFKKLTAALAGERARNYKYEDSYAKAWRSGEVKDDERVEEADQDFRDRFYDEGTAPKTTARTAEAAPAEAAPAAPKKAAPKRQRKPSVVKKAKEAVAATKDEDDYIAQMNEELAAEGDQPLSPEQEAENRKQYRADVAAEAAPAPEAAEATAETVEEAAAEESLEEQQARLEKQFLKELGDVIDPSAMSLMGAGAVNAGAVAKMVVTGTQLGLVYAQQGVGSFKAWSKKMIETFGESVRPYLKRIYKSVDQAAQDEGIPGTEELNSKDMDKQLAEMDKKPAKAKKRTNNKSKKKASAKRKGKAVKEAVAPNAPPSLRQAVKGDSEPTVSDVKEQLGYKPTIFKEEEEAEFADADVVDVGPFPNKGLAVGWVKRKKEKDFKTGVSKDYFIVEGTTKGKKTYSIRSQSKEHKVEIITEETLSPVDVSLKRRQAEQHEEALKRFEEKESDEVGRASSPDIRSDDELQRKTPEEKELIKEKLKLEGKLGNPNITPDARQIIRDEINDVQAQLEGLIVAREQVEVEGGGTQEFRQTRRDDTIFRGGRDEVGPEFIEEQEESYVRDQIEVTSEKISNPDAAFVSAATANDLVSKDQHEDMTDILSRGLSATIKSRLIDLIKQGGLFAGLPVVKIEFSTTRLGSPMFTNGTDGDTTIRVDINKLAYYLSGPTTIQQINKDGNVQTITKQPASLSEMLSHELHHVVLWRAVKTAYLKEAKEDGVVKDFSKEELQRRFQRINSKNVKVLEEMLANKVDGAQEMFLNWKNHIALYFGTEPGLQIRFNPETNRIENAAGEDAQVNSYQAGMEWVVFLLDHMNSGKDLPATAEELVKHNTKKILEFTANLTDHDLGDSVSTEVMNLIEKARILVQKNNAFTRRIRELDRLGVTETMVDVWKALSKRKEGGNFKGNIRVPEFLSRTWNYMTDNAYALNEAFKEIDGQVWVPTKLGSNRSHQVPVSIQDDWHQNDGVWVFKVNNEAGWTRTWDGIVNVTGNSLKDLKRNNPGVFLRSQGSTIGLDEYVLVYSTDKKRYNTKQAEQNWYDKSVEYATGKKNEKSRPDSSSVATEFSFISELLSRDVVHEGLARTLKDEGFSNPVLTSEEAAAVNSQTEAVMPRPNPVRSGYDPVSADVDSDLVTRAEMDMFNDLLLETNENGEQHFRLINFLNYGMTPLGMAYAVKAIARNINAKGGFINYKRAAQELQTYHNTRVTNLEKTKTNITEAKTRIEALNSSKPSGYRALVKQHEARLEQLETQEKERLEFFGPVSPRKLEVSESILENEIMPAFREAIAEAGVTPAQAKAMFENSQARIRQTIDETGFPVNHEMDETMLALAGISGGQTQRSRDGQSEYRTLSEADIEGIVNRTSNWIRTGSQSDRAEAWSVSEVQERVRRLGQYLNGREPSGETLEMQALYPHDAQRAAVFAGIMKGLSETELTLADTASPADKQILVEQRNWVQQHGGNSISQKAQTLRHKQTIDRMMGHHDARKGYESALRQRHLDDFGNVIDFGWVDKISNLIKQAGYAAGTRAIAEHIKNGGVDPIKTMIDKATFYGNTGPGFELALESAIHKAMRNLSENSDGDVKFINDETLRDQLNKELANAEIQSDLTEGDMLKLSSFLMKVWRAQRAVELTKLIGANEGLLTGGKVTRDVLLNSVANLLVKADAGSFDSNNYAEVRIGTVKVPSNITAAWDAVAAAAYKSDNGFFGDSVSIKLMELSRQIEQEGLEGVRAAHIREEMIRTIVENTPVDYTALLRDTWFAHALSGIRTFVDIATGGVMHGALSTLMLSFEVGVIGTGRKRGDALNMMSAFARGLWEGGAGFVDIMRTGDMSKLPDAQERQMKLLDSQEDFYGGYELEKYAKSGKVGSNYAGLLKFVRRAVLGLDYIGATAGRNAMLVYGSSTRHSLLDAAIANETNPAALKELKRERADLEKAYVSGQKLFDKNERAAAFERAIREIHGARYEEALTEADVKRHANEPLVKARVREILEEDLAKAGDLAMSSSELGRVFALNADPIGLGGVVHNALQGFEVFKYPAGFAFSRAAMNMASNASNWIPVFSLVNWARSSNNRVTDWMAKQKWAKSINIQPSTRLHPNRKSASKTATEEGDVMTPERAALIRAQAITSTALGLAAWATLKGFDDEGDEDGWDIVGSLNSVNPKDKKQLLSQGVKPYSFKLGDHYISYKNMPFAAWMTGMGNLRDGKKWAKWDERTEMEKFLDQTMGGWSFVMDVGPTTQAFQLLSTYERGTDMAQFTKKFTAQFLQGGPGTAVPVLGANLIKEVDSWTDTSYRKPSKDEFLGHYLMNMAFARRINKPMLNVFGEEVEIVRTPWDRWYAGPANPDQLVKKYPAPALRREWKLAGKWARDDVYIPGAGKGMQILGEDLVKREMNEDELYEYQKVTGNLLRDRIIGSIEWLEEATPEQAERWLDKTSARIKKKVARQIALDARQR